MHRVSSASERRPGRPIRILLLSAIVLSLVAPAATMAGKAATTTPWIALASVSDARTATGAQPRLGSSVKFSTGYPTGTKNPWVSVICFQDGVMVYGEGGKPSAEFVLGGASSDWVGLGGAATCRAELGDLFWRGGHQYYTDLAETWFDAGG